MRRGVFAAVSHRAGASGGATFPDASVTLGFLARFVDLVDLVAVGSESLATVLR